ncbi:MAG: HYR domain-containing protein [Bacteroidota bacterium]|nr:HYR domain-containing protein [Bacteroidota bacterium]
MVLVVKDEHGDSSTCTGTVTVEDAAAPQIFCPADIEIAVDAGQCHAVVAFSATASDNCSITSINYYIGSTEIISPHAFPLGPTQVRSVARDGSGNESECVFTVTVHDDIPPLISCPAAIEQNTDAGLCTAIIPFSAIATDNCSVGVLKYYSGSMEITSPHVFPLGVTPVRVVAKDNSDNSSECSFLVTVVDAAAPVPALPSLPDVIGECSAAITTTPTATDNCAGTIIGTTSDPLTYSTQGVHIVTWIFNDGNGNIAQQTQRVIVQDVSGPVIGLNQAALYLWSPNHQYETITMPQIVASLTDNCGAANIRIMHVTSDEPEDDPGSGDGSTLDDIVIASNCQSLQIRSERDGGRNGRVYRIFLEAEDANGNKTNTSFCVSVQHNSNTPAIEDAAAYTVYSACYTSKAPSSSAAVADGYSLEQNYPNPFNPSTTISYALPEETFVRIRVLDSYGRRVRSLVDAVKPAGSHRVEFDGSDLPSGIYIYRLEAGDRRISRTMTLLK